MKALIISADNFEDSELLVPYYRLKEARVEVDVAFMKIGIIKGKHGYQRQRRINCCGKDTPLGPGKISGNIVIVLLIKFRPAETQFKKVAEGDFVISAGSTPSEVFYGYCSLPRESDLEMGSKHCRFLCFLDYRTCVSDSHRCFAPVCRAPDQSAPDGLYG